MVFALAIAQLYLVITIARFLGVQISQSMQSKLGELL